MLSFECIAAGELSLESIDKFSELNEPELVHHTHHSRICRPRDNMSSTADLKHGQQSSSVTQPEAETGTTELLVGKRLFLLFLGHVWSSLHNIWACIVYALHLYLLIPHFLLRYLKLSGTVEYLLKRLCLDLDKIEAHAAKLVGLSGLKYCISRLSGILKRELAPCVDQMDRLNSEAQILLQEQRTQLQNARNLMQRDQQSPATPPGAPPHRRVTVQLDSSPTSSEIYHAAIQGSRSLDDLLDSDGTRAGDMANRSSAAAKLKAGLRGELYDLQTRIVSPPTVFEPPVRTFSGKYQSLSPRSDSDSETKKQHDYQDPEDGRCNSVGDFAVQASPSKSRSTATNIKGKGHECLACPGRGSSESERSTGSKKEKPKFDTSLNTIAPHHTVPAPRKSSLKVWRH